MSSRSRKDRRVPLCRAPYALAGAYALPKNISCPRACGILQRLHERPFIRVWPRCRIQTFELSLKFISFRSIVRSKVCVHYDEGGYRFPLEAAGVRASLKSCGEHGRLSAAILLEGDHWRRTKVLKRRME